MKLEPGATLGPYRVGRLLARGGIGEVYRAEDTRLSRADAIKILEIADESDRRRFQQEARMALNHPHILTVHDVGDVGGRQYLVTEFVDGGTLRDWAPSGTRNWRQIVELLIGVADALATAHGAGILRQRFPDGPAEQLTSGPTEEQGIALDPDGRSFVTSVGESQSTIWIRDAGRSSDHFAGLRFLAGLLERRGVSLLSATLRGEPALRQRRAVGRGGRHGTPRAAPPGLSHGALQRVARRSARRFRQRRRRRTLHGVAGDARHQLATAPADLA
jgi:hypothetical protein